MIGRNKFASAVLDSGNSALILPSDWNAEISVGYILTNRTGGTLNAGDVVAIDSANDNSVVLADTTGARRAYVVCVSALPSSAAHTPATSIANLAQGIFCPVGVANVAVAGATVRGNYLRKSATSKALEDTSVAVGSAPPGDAIATALTGTSGAGIVSAAFHGLPISPGGNLKSIQVFTASGTWNRPAGIRRVLMYVVGGGGGGGGVDATATQSIAAGGGGGGGCAVRLLDVSSIATSTITIGAGGAGGAAGLNNGSSGNNSSWADGVNTVTGNGGSGGTAGNLNTSAPGGAGGATGGETFPIRGGPGGTGFATGTAAVASGQGGSSHLGGGAPSAVANNNGTAATANTGGGGSGGIDHAANTDRSGGAGGSGIVVVYEYE